MQWKFKLTGTYGNKIFCLATKRETKFVLSCAAGIFHIEDISLMPQETNFIEKSTDKVDAFFCQEKAKKMPLQNSEVELNPQKVGSDSEP